MFSSFTLAALIGLALSTAHAAPAGFPEPSPQVQEIYVFPVNTSVENLAVRSNGHVLASVDSAPELYQISPYAVDPRPALVHSFDGYGGLLGIVELAEDQFYVAAGNFSVFTLESVPGSWSIFHVDLSSFKAQPDGSIASPAAIEKVADIPEGELLNGLGVFSAEEGLVYVADSGSGIIYLVDVASGDYWPAIQDPLSVKGEPIPDYPAANGVHYDAESHSVYFTNVAQELFARVPVAANGSQAGPAEVVAQGELYDDFLLDGAGSAIVAVFGSNDVIKVDLASGNSTVIAGSQNATELQAATAVAKGRTPVDSNSLYVSRNGGIGQPTVVGGGIVKINRAF
ncbi:hypothetical protein K523DRAFT_262410, partial [Schizophyllum commune Tattone D]